MEKSIELGSMSRTSVKNDRWSKRGAHKNRACWTP